MVNWILLAICAGLIVAVLRLFLKLEKAREDYAALEQGANEQQENFEQEYLSFDQTQEKNRELEEDNQILKAQIQELMDANAVLNSNVDTLTRSFNIHQGIAADRLQIIRRQQAEIEAIRRAHGG